MRVNDFGLLLGRTLHEHCKSRGLDTVEEVLHVFAALTLEPSQDVLAVGPTRQPESRPNVVGVCILHPWQTPNSTNMQSSAARPDLNRLAGRFAILSGVFGITAFACLMLFLVMRPSAADLNTSHLLLRSHDIGVILQSLCLIPFALVLDAIARAESRGSSRVTGAAAVSSLAFVVVLMLLSVFKVVADVLYMIPQGVVGVWLIVTCGRKASGLPRGLRRLGILAGTGLVLVSVFPIGYFLFVDPAILHGPVSDDDPTPPGTERANEIVHIALAIGTLVGCSTYPIWTALTGRWLLLRGFGDGAA